MAKFELKFLDFNEGNTIQVSSNLKPDYNNDIIDICIYDKYNNNYNYISLDKSTAIKFAKTLRTEINKITESEVNNG
jgi:predicted Zn-dependent protease